MKNNIINETPDAKTRPPKSPEGGLWDSANQVEYCYRAPCLILLRQLA